MLSPSFGNLNQRNLSRFSGSDDPCFARQPMPRDGTYSSWGSDASSQSGRSDSSMSMPRPAQTTSGDRDRRLDIEEAPPGSISGTGGLLTAIHPFFTIWMLSSARCSFFIFFPVLPSVTPSLYCSVLSCVVNSLCEVVYRRAGIPPFVPLHTLSTPYTKPRS